MEVEERVSRTGAKDMEQCLEPWPKRTLRWHYKSELFSGQWKATIGFYVGEEHEIYAWQPATDWEHKEHLKYMVLYGLMLCLPQSHVLTFLIVLGHGP